MQIFKLSYFVFFSCFKGQIISLNFYFKDWHLWRISPSNHLTLRFVLEFHFIKPDPLTAKGEILWEWQCLPNGFCVRFCVPCSPKWAFLSQSAVKLTFWQLCGSSQRQDAFRLPNCLLNEIVVIFPGHLVLHLPTSCQWFGRWLLIWELTWRTCYLCTAVKPLLD